MDPRGAVGRREHRVGRGGGRRQLGGERRVVEVGDLEVEVVEEVPHPGRVAGRALLVVEREDQVVLGARGGDVEQADPLVLVDALLVLGPGLEPLGGEAAPRLDLGTRRPPQHLHRGGRSRGLAQAADDHQGELEALGAVGGEDAHRVVVGLGERDLTHLGPVVGEHVGPGEPAAQVGAAGLDEGPRLVDHPAEAAPDVAGAGLVEGQGERTEVGHDAVEHRWRRVDLALAVQQRQVGQGVGDGAGGIVGLGPARVPPAAGELPADQVVVATAVERGAQRRHDRELVAGVGDGADHGAEVGDVGGGEHQRRRLQAVGDAGVVERPLQRGQLGGGGHQHGDVARPERLARVADGPALGQGPADEAGGVGPGRLAHGRHGGVEGAAEEDARPGGGGGVHGAPPVARTPVARCRRPRRTGTRTPR